MNIRKEEVDGSTEITIEVNEKDMSWFKELFSYEDEKSFFWADGGVIVWFVKEDKE